MRKLSVRNAAPNHVTNFIRSTFAKERRKRLPGSPPGIEHLANANEPPTPGSLVISTIDFAQDRHERRTFETIEALEADERPAWATARWIDIQGLHPYVLRRLQHRFGIHPLAAEDALNFPQRPKVEDYGDSLYVVMKMLRLEDHKLHTEQISFFYFKDMLITLQQEKGDVWDSVRQRIEKPSSRFRQFGSPYLLYALLDAIVDHLFPLLDVYFERLNELEDEIYSGGGSELQNRVHSLKRELSVLRQAVWPIRDLIASLRKDEYDLIPESVETYLRDVYDHSLQVNETVEMYREAAHELQNLLMAAVSNRSNEVMKALTIMASLFLPLTFFAGVYGMNFAYFPELQWRYAYPTFWGVSLVLVAALVYYFKKKRWIGK